ncbi:MAG: hypothetical protein WA733_13530 [Methylocystis sp.]
MKPIVEFLKSTILGGLLVLLPQLLSWSLLAKAFDIIVKMATPVVHLLPRSILVEAPRLKELATVVALVTASFIFGMLLRAAFFRNVINLMETRTLGRLPVYAALKGLVSEAFQPEASGGFKPAMLLLAEGMQRPAYVIEDHGDGNLTVFSSFGASGILWHDPRRIAGQGRFPRRQTHRIGPEHRAIWSGTARLAEEEEAKRCARR